MKVPYTFALLRYFHDVVSGEFVNVGIVVYSREAEFLQAKCLESYRRMSAFFGGVEGMEFRRAVRHIQRFINTQGERLRRPSLIRHASSEHERVTDLPRDVRGWVDRVLPPDDSAYQFSESRGGVTDDLQATVDRLYERYVLMYVSRPSASRSDEDVWRTFREPLEQYDVLQRLQPKTISSESYEHEFPQAWKNGRWNVSESVSFDLVDPGSILEKANKWLGRMVNLQDTEEEVKLYLLLGAPQEGRNRTAYAKAKDTLHKASFNHELIEEDEAEDFAAQIASEIHD